jgi:CheY-like chemotaxis protein
VPRAGRGQLPDQAGPARGAAPDDPDPAGRAARAGPPPPAARRPRAPSRRRLRVLLAEDNPVNQALAVNLLKRQGHDVTVVGNGRDALTALEREPIDLVLMDVQMPGWNGFEATAAIRAWEQGTGRHVPIVALTAHAMKGDRERCLPRAWTAT